MLANPLPSFWSQELSEVWSGATIESGIERRQKQLTLGLEISALSRSKRSALLQSEARRQLGQKLRFRVEQLRGQTPVTEGQCPLCEEEGKLISEVCETCFEPWAISVASDAIGREMEEERQRAKGGKWHKEIEWGRSLTIEL